MARRGLYAVIVDREMDYVVRRITEAISSGSPRERVERASLAFLSYVRDHPDGFAVLSQDSPLSSSRGTISSLLNDMAERVGDVFVSALKEAGYDPKAAPIYANTLKAPEISTTMGTSETVEFLAVSNRAEPDTAYVPPAEFLLVPASLVHDNFVATARSLDLRTYVFTVNDPVEMASFIEEGVDGILTDDPKLMTDVIQELEGGAP